MKTLYRPDLKAHNLGQDTWSFRKDVKARTNEPQHVPLADSGTIQQPKDAFWKGTSEFEDASSTVSKNIEPPVSESRTLPQISGMLWEEIGGSRTVEPGKSERVLLGSGTCFEFISDVPGHIRFNETKAYFDTIDGRSIELLGADLFTKLFNAPLPPGHCLRNGTLYRLTGHEGEPEIIRFKNNSIRLSEYSDPEPEAFKSIVDEQINSGSPIRPLPKIPYPLQPVPGGPSGVIVFQYTSEEDLMNLSPCYDLKKGRFNNSPQIINDMDYMLFERMRGTPPQDGLGLCRDEYQRFGVPSSMYMTISDGNASFVYNPTTLQPIPAVDFSEGEATQPMWFIKQDSLRPLEKTERGIGLMATPKDNTFALVNVLEFNEDCAKVSYIARDGRQVLVDCPVGRLFAPEQEHPTRFDVPEDDLNTEDIRGQLTKGFPELQNTAFSIVGVKTGKYNCFAEALGIRTAFLGLFNRADLDVQFAQHGFIRIENEQPIDFTKLQTLKNIELAVVYGNPKEDGSIEPQHFVRGVDGVWYSKNGQLHHVKVSRCDALQGDDYGHPYALYARPRLQWREIG